MTSIHPSSVQNPHEAASVQSTPGFEVPGAFPREHTATTRQHPLSDSRRASERPQRISLPSSEKEGTHPGEHSGGVGSLPGSISETSVAKLPDERASERKAASASASRSKEITTDTDSEDDPDDAVAVAELPDERASEGEAASASASRSKEITADTDCGDDPAEAVVAAAAPASSPVVAEVPDERAREGKADSESTSRPKGLFAVADTDRGDDARKGVAVAPAASSGAPGVTNHRQDISTVRRTNPQGPSAVGEQVPPVLRAETRVSLS